MRDHLWSYNRNGIFFDEPDTTHVFEQSVLIFESIHALFATELLYILYYTIYRGIGKRLEWLLKTNKKNRSSSMLVQHSIID